MGEAKEPTWSVMIGSGARTGGTWPNFRRRRGASLRALARRARGAALGYAGSRRSLATSSGFCTLPMALRGSDSAKTKSFGTL